MNSYTIELENDRLLEVQQFIEFCAKHQGTDIVLRANNEGHCLRFTGVYDILDLFSFNSVKIITANALEHHDRYNINNKSWTYWVNKLDNFDHAYDYSWSTDKIFGCVYGRPSAPRLGIASHLAKEYDSKSYIKHKFDFSTEDSRKLFDVQRLFAWDSVDIDKLNQSRFRSEFHYDPSNHNVGNPLNYEYKKFLIDIVSEPTCKGDTFYPTEKIIRPILCRHPFIAMTSKNYLIYLRQMGIRTFQEFWDEDYDGYDGKERYIKILKLIETLAKKSDKEILEMYAQMRDILDHNYEIVYNRKLNKQLRYVE